MNGYECFAGALAVILLSSLGRFLVARQGSDPLQASMDVKHVGKLQSLYVLLGFSVFAFLGKDALLWSGYAFEIPFGLWQILLGLLSTLNMLVLLLPFLF